MTRRTIAVFTRAKNGVSYHRQITPHAHLNGKYGDEFEILIYEKPSDVPDADWERIRLVHFCGYFDFQKEDFFRRKGIVVVLDKDDWWNVPQHNPHFGQWQMGNFWYRTELSIVAADHVICTTGYLADKVKELNPNVTVIPNALPPLKQFIPEPWEVNPDRIRFGWLGADSHLYDLALMKESFKRLDKGDFRKNFQIVLGGFAIHRDITTIGKGGVIQKKRIKPFDTIFGMMERIVTDDYRLLKGDTTYLKHLAEYRPEVQGEEFMASSRAYRRIWWTNVEQYATAYNQFDVSIAPLIDDEFNRCKSQLKVIEAGFMGRPIIASRVQPYLEDCKEDNSILVDQDRAGIDFFTAMRRFAKNPSLVKDMGENLRQDVMKKYNMDLVNETRRDLYKRLIDKA